MMAVPNHPTTNADSGQEYDNNQSPHHRVTALWLCLSSNYPHTTFPVICS
jgi:hypothetical protein